ncbi:hypothetical protein SAMN04488511_11439 [Pedobacter suwonensis]|uniref:Uncharacterized protein n=1 Tax=Pedobacter suwonensis TaxID=332999 RepID=A0A1I0TT66_9SPHI|nr:hypothetical protein [Pedobacter suwonensis]SFA54900.1 hypothetical protein SAMN04488511_11439 [Pedobacter suwonensis]
MNTIKLNFIPYQLKGITGTVEHLDKSSNTHVFGSTGYTHGNHYSTDITSAVVVGDDIYLKDKTGKDHLFRLRNFDVACRAGNTLTVVSTSRWGKAKGRNLVVINHNLDRAFYHKYNVKRLCAPNKYLLIGVFAILTYFIVPAFTFYFIGEYAVTLIVLALVLVAYYFTMTKVNEQKLKAAIEPKYFL